MDWGSLVGFALLITLSIIVLRLLWHWLITLFALGPPTYAGIVVGHFIGAHFESIGVGLLAAVIVSGCLIETRLFCLRRAR